jgi:hypothetical protein
MKTQDELIAALVSALETCRYELLTLVPRLTSPYAANAQAAANKAKDALDAAKETKHG